MPKTQSPQQSGIGVELGGNPAHSSHSIRPLKEWGIRSVVSGCLELQLTRIETRSPLGNAWDLDAYELVLLVEI